MSLWNEQLQPNSMFHIEDIEIPNLNTLDTQIVGTNSSESLYYYKPTSNIIGNVKDFLETPSANLSSSNGFQNLQRIYLRMSRSTQQDISINVSILHH